MRKYYFHHENPSCPTNCDVHLFFRFITFLLFRRHSCAPGTDSVLRAQFREPAMHLVRHVIFSLIPSEYIVWVEPFLSMTNAHFICNFINGSPWGRGIPFDLSLNLITCFNPWPTRTHINNPRSPSCESLHPSLNYFLVSHNYCHMELSFFLTFHWF
jgi:hypothetical protein